jgi:putative glutamine amidotransferase
MSVSRPAIGILTPITVAAYGVWNQPSAVMPANYIAAVHAAGGLALLATPDPRLIDDPDELLDRLDGLVLAGGADLDPDVYAAVPNPETVGSQRDRDDFEVTLARRAVDRDLPLLGICRGIQVLNVAFGGTLHQHLPETFGHGEHRRVPGSFDGAEHDVALTADSLAARAAGELVHSTRSHHHQGVDRVGDGLVVSGIAVMDELVEAIELPDRRFVLGVQWHPEADPPSRVISAFVHAAAEFRDARSAVAGAVAGAVDQPRATTASISTLAPLGSAETAIATRAGGSASKNEL